MAARVGLFLPRLLLLLLLGRDTGGVNEENCEPEPGCGSKQLWVLVLAGRLEACEKSGASNEGSEQVESHGCGSKGKGVRADVGVDGSMDLVCTALPSTARELVEMDPIR